jgi:hypothetical protein
MLDRRGDFVVVVVVVVVCLLRAAFEVLLHHVGLFAGEADEHLKRRAASKVERMNTKRFQDENLNSDDCVDFLSVWRNACMQCVED